MEQVVNDVTNRNYQSTSGTYSYDRAQKYCKIRCHFYIQLKRSMSSGSPQSFQYQLLPASWVLTIDYVTYDRVVWLIHQRIVEAKLECDCILND